MFNNIRARFELSVVSLSCFYIFQTDIMEVCPSPLRLAQQLTHIELVSMSL